jgi:serine/threonine protein phosphatase 1
VAGRRIAIGDIHGCDLALRRLIHEIKPNPKDLIITLGDYLDRGPNARGVVDQLLDLPKHCHTVHLLGNHEIMLLNVLDGAIEFEFWLRSGGAETLASYDGSLRNIPQEHLDFFKRCLPYYEMDDCFFVHANYTPTLPLSRQPDFALFWEHLSDHLPERHINGKKAIVGHTPQRDGDVFAVDHLICLDTYCYGGKYLTAMDLDSLQIWQADLHGKTRGEN